MAPKWVPVIYLEATRLDSEFQLSSSSNGWDIERSFSSMFWHQGGSGATFKYYVNLGILIQFFGHPEHQNRSIIDAIGFCSRIRKKLYGEQTENREQRNQLLRPLYRHTNGTPGWAGQLANIFRISVCKKNHVTSHVVKWLWYLGSIWNYDAL